MHICVYHMCFYCWFGELRKKLVFLLVRRLGRPWAGAGKTFPTTLSVSNSCRRLRSMTEHSMKVTIVFHILVFSDTTAQAGDTVLYTGSLSTEGRAFLADKSYY